MPEDKAALRRRLRAEAARLPEAYLAASNAALFRRVTALDAYRGADTIFTYVSINRECDTRRIIAHAMAAGKRVYVPRCHGGGVMDACMLESLEQLRPAAMGLLEPGPGAAVLPLAALAFTLVPCLAADRQGHRLGQGGGYYDRALPKLGGAVVCLCRGRLVQSALPADPWDARPGMVLTEDGAIYTAGGEADA